MTAPATIPPPSTKRVRTSDALHGIVYFMANLALSTVKVGYTTNLKKRLDVLQTGNHNRLEVCCFIKANREVENAIQRALKPFSIRNEWFEHEACVDDLIRKIEDFEIERGVKTGDFSPIIHLSDLDIILQRWHRDWPSVETMWKKDDE